MNPTYEEIEAKIALLEVQLKLSEAAERAWESSMMQACGEDGPKSVADKFAELESKLETALRECRSAGITIDNLEAKCAALAADNEKAMEAMRQADAAVKLAHEKFSAMAAENAALKESEREFDKMCAEEFGPDWVSELTETPATDAFLAEVRAQGLALFAASLKVAGICEHQYLDAAIDLAAKLRQNTNSDMLQGAEPVTDNTNQQFESLSRGDK